MIAQLLHRAAEWFESTSELRSHLAVLNGSDGAVAVNQRTAMGLTAMYAATNVISSAVAVLPVQIKSRRTAEDVDTDTDAYRLLASTPNPYQTPMVFRQTLMVNTLFWGNGFAFIQRDPTTYAPLALYPLQTDEVQARRENGQMMYLVRMKGGETFDVDSDHMVHVLAMSFDGVTGLNPIEYARRTIGTAIGLEEYAARVFANGGMMGGIIETPKMKPEAIDAFAKAWTANYTGIKNAFKVAMLPDGMKFHPGTHTTPESAQALESRVHQLREIARLFNVPPHMVGDLERATFSNIEHQAIQFQQQCVRPWTVRVEQEMERKLLTEEQRRAVQIRFNLDSLLRADTTQRYTAHNLALTGGWKTVNEVRALEGLPPVAGGDVLRAPLNTAPISGPPTA